MNLLLAALAYFGFCLFVAAIAFVIGWLLEHMG